MKASLMKSIFAVVAVLSVVSAGIVPTAGQRKKSESLDAWARLSARSVEVAAFSDGRGAFITWQSTSEVNVLGYDIYRYSGKRRVKANRSIILGGGLKDPAEAGSGGSFEFFDRFGTHGSFYQIEAVAIGGTRMAVATAAVQPIADLASLTGHSSQEFLRASENAVGEVQSVTPSVPKALAAETMASLMSPSSDTQKWVASQSAAKIAVKQEGIHRVLKTDLQNIGFDVSGSARYWRLFADGNEQAIRVAPDESYFEFYGRGRDTRESDTRIYYLVTGNVKGRRMPSVSARSVAGPAVTTSFPTSLSTKYRSNYWSQLLNGDAENYFGDLVSPTRRDVLFNVPQLDTAQASVTLTVRLQGANRTAHTVNISVNGTQVGNMSFSNFDSFSKAFTVPMSAMLSGSNTVSLTSVGGSSDYSYTDTITFSYARRYRAESNRLAFFTAANKQVKLEGFATSAVTVYDVTAPESPQIVSNAVFERSQGGREWSASLTTLRSRSMYAVQDGSALVPTSITLNSPSTLSSTSNEGNYLIVTHRDFLAEANAWAAFRASDGFSPKVVDIEDVFDEFSFGSMSTDGMNAFFAFAEYNWTVGPNYVLLIGDASWDYKGYEGQPFANFVPTRLFDTLFEETGSDDALVDLNGDGLADIPVGRIPVRVAADVTRLMNKTVQFDSESATALVSRGGLFVSDYPDGYDFQRINTDLSGYLLRMPTPAPVTSVYADPLATARAALIPALNSGHFIINFSGHGSQVIWQASMPAPYRGTLLSGTDVAGMTNATRLSVFTLLTCLNGFFTFSDTRRGLAETALMATGGGAAAAWASTAKTTADVQEVMANRFYSKLAGGTIPRLGDLIKDSKTSLIGGRDVRLSWTLLGDPALKMR